MLTVRAARRKLGKPRSTQIGGLSAVAPAGSSSEDTPSAAPSTNGELSAATVAPSSVQPSAGVSKSPPGASV